LYSSVTKVRNALALLFAFFFAFYFAFCAFFFIVFVAVYWFSSSFSTLLACTKIGYMSPTM
jgi:hypothetical protein